jgi:succinate dehydrogenase flavin-adding protein (antitoxin of CptAB toxin-antitoxin module)
MDAVRHNRLRWKCRRGLLELDIVLQRFLEANALEDEALESFTRLLDLPDTELWDVVAGRSDRYAPGLSEIVARLRAA